MHNAHIISVRRIDSGQTTICQKKNPKGHGITRIRCKISICDIYYSSYRYVYEDSRRLNLFAGCTLRWVYK